MLNKIFHFNIPTGARRRRDSNPPASLPNFRLGPSGGGWVGVQQSNNNGFTRPNFLKKNLGGFTLIECLIAIFLITIGTLGASSLVNQTTVFTQVTSSRLVAAYLAQEGIEIVRNIRDSNFLKIHRGVEGINWDTGLTGCAAGCETNYYNSILILADYYLKIDGGFYNYDSGENTPFKRKIIIRPGTDILKVQVLVSWQERGRTHQVITQENLYKWMQ